MRETPGNAVPFVFMRMLQVKVKPGARQSLLAEQPDGTWLATLKSPPVDGRANAELIALVAGHFGCRRAQVSIRAGAGGRRKLVKIEE
jgi:uncharacterized protein YggU (UPF0235/DUF167 family)